MYHDRYDGLICFVVLIEHGVSGLILICGMEDALWG